MLSRIESFTRQGDAGIKQLARELADAVDDPKPLTVSAIHGQLATILSRPFGPEDIAAIMVKVRDPSVQKKARYLSSCLYRKACEQQLPLS
jgi:hypothetical protein